MSRIVFYNTLSIAFNTLLTLYVVEEGNLKRMVNQLQYAGSVHFI